MTAAYVYFACMALIMLPLASVHLACRNIVKAYPQIMPDNFQRDRYRLSELWMAVRCSTMLFYMWMILDFMVTFCATQPLLGALAHVPWIVGSLAVLLCKTGHLMRLRNQAGLWHKWGGPER